LIKNISLEEGVARMAAWAKKTGARQGKLSRALKVSKNLPHSGGVGSLRQGELQRLTGGKNWQNGKNILVRIEISMKYHTDATFFLIGVLNEFHMPIVIFYSFQNSFKPDN